MPSEEQPTKENLPTHHNHTDAHTHPLHPSWRNPWVIIASALVLLFLVVSFVSFHRANVSIMRSGAFPGAPGMVKRGFAGPGGGFGGKRFTTTDTDTRINGVVTAVNGNTVTVAGNGTTHAVTTSASTQYSGASAAAVNDTIIARGTISGSTFTASTIVVNP